MVWQPSLLAAGPARLDSLSQLRRIVLDESSWIDHGIGIVGGADDLFGELVDTLAWRGERRVMYDRIVDVPRRTAAFQPTDTSIPTIVADLAAAFGDRYEHRFDLVFANLYRDGDDAVAWHRDRIGRRHRHPVIAIVSLGHERRFRLRPLGGGRGLTISLGGGDVLVMGGACQHRWEHTVPRMRGAGPRISLTFRHDHGPDDRPSRLPAAGSVSPALPGRGRLTLGDGTVDPPAGR